MVIYDLMCPLEHRFEGWFRSESDYHEQHNNGQLSCPICDSKQVKKVPTASYISTGKGRMSPSQAKPNSLPSVENTSTGQASIDVEAMRKLISFVETQTEDVGRQFVEEAKKMHYGESEQRNIRGEATVKEMVELHDEGIEVIPLPLSPKPAKKLN